MLIVSTDSIRITNVYCKSIGKSKYVQKIVPKNNELHLDLISFTIVLFTSHLCNQSFTLNHLKAVTLEQQLNASMILLLFKVN